MTRGIAVCLALAFALAGLAGCGGSTAAEEEETASWTSGDDAPLEGAPDGATDGTPLGGAPLEGDE